ncbi:uncharacterized protein LOC114266574 isoform X3 [Camellia sinensis]|uniref:uncharacterized protein LOC114266574 isoform X3 n=1 Tax=Camellia sinensis TaxID=4442 RepID=UPI001036B370|nr:uncharacterized protein LOC114266574 isoform X3 [Camellia sinensis]
MDWVEEIRQKFEILCLEVDGVVHETVGANIENQVQTMGANIKQFCSEFVHDVMPSFSPDFMEGVTPELSPQKNKNVNLTAQESSMIGVDIDPKKGLCNKNSLAHQYCMEPVDEKRIDLLSKKKDDIGMSEKLNVSVMENATAKKPFPTEIPVVVDTAEKDSSLTSLFCGVNASDDERWDGQDDLSTPVSLDGYHSCMKEGETTGLTTADNSNVLPSANSVILVESCKCGVSDTGLTSVDACSAISSEGSDNVGTEKFTDGQVIEPAMETTNFSELKLDESCIVVDSAKLCSVCLRAAKSQSYKKKICEAFTAKMKSAKEQEREQQAPRNEDRDAGLNQHKGERLAPPALTTKIETVDHDFCDSEWEII